MKISLQNIGPLKKACFRLEPLTIICGKNNTGKTYATYSLYGFLAFWNEGFQVKVREDIHDTLIENGTASIDLVPYIARRNEILLRAGEEYICFLPGVLASKPDLFEDSFFRLELDDPFDCPLPLYERSLGGTKRRIFELKKEEGAKRLDITLLVEPKRHEIDRNSIDQIISDALKEILFGHLFPTPFIASTERTGAAIFRKELNFARNRLLEQMPTIERELDAFTLLTKTFSDYALPVKSNVDFIRDLENCSKKESEISKKDPMVLDDFAAIIGGKYRVMKDGELYFVPDSNKRLRLTMEESSSTVRSMLDIGFYVKHVAAEGDILMVDEPELNLHPENQRKFARLMARLLRCGVRVYLTTHSDYLVKEINTLIMLGKKGEHIANIREQAGYKPDEVISSKDVAVFIAKKAPVLLNGRNRKTSVPTLVEAKIDEDTGIHADTFDSTIDEMDRIQRALFFGKDQF